MRTNDALTLLQADLRNRGNILATGQQYQGIYYGIVTQTDASAPGAITPGNMTLTIPALNPTWVWGPIPYPGSEAPPAGTTCSVGFLSSNVPAVLAFYGWSAIPSGTIAPYPLGTVPSGWSLCDGSTLSSTAYPNLWRAIKTTFGGGSAKTTVKLPKIDSTDTINYLIKH